MPEVIPSWEDTTEITPTWDETSPVKASEPVWEDTVAAHGQGTARAIRGWEKLRSPVDLINEESIPAHLISYFSTTEEEYKTREKQNKQDTLESIPAIADLNARLDEFEIKASDGVLTPEEDATYVALQDAYGTIYQKLEKAYDEGELDQGFSFSALGEAIADDPTGTLAEFANGLMASPELALTPLGWSKAAYSAGAVATKLGATAKGIQAAKVAGGITGTGLAGGAWGVTYSTAEQLDRTGEVDPQEVAEVGAVSALAAPIIIGASKAAVSTLKGAGKATRAAQLQARVDSYLPEISQKIADDIAKGEKQDIAIQRAINQTVTDRTLRQELRKRHSWVTEKHPSEIPPTRKTVVAVGKAVNRFADATKPFRTYATDFFAPVATELSMINSKLGYAVERYDFELGQRIKSGLDHKVQLESLYKKLTSKQKDDLWWSLANQDRKGALKLAQGDSEATTILKNIFKYLDDVGKRSEATGMKMGLLSDYFPRFVKDYKKYIKDKGYKVSEVKSGLISELNKKLKLTKKESKLPKSTSMKEIQDMFTPDEFAAALDKVLSTRKGESTIRTTARPQQSRVIESVPIKDLKKHYLDPITSLTNYINAMEMKIATREFFGGAHMDVGIGKTVGGKVIKSESDITDATIGKYVDELLRVGEIIEEDLGRVNMLLKARFVGGMSSPGKVSGAARDILYSMTLGNPFSAGTQLGDTGASVYLNGVRATMEELPKVLGRKNVIKMEDMGLANLVEELEHLRPTARLLDSSLKYSGFKLVDRIGKETVMNAALNKYQRMSKNTKGRVKIANKYRDAYEPEALKQLIKDLQNGKMTQDVRFMLWHELSKVQPISLSQMPAKYLEHPNGRIFYMLKTFTLKQIDIMRRDAYDQIKRGNVKLGMSNMLRHVGVLGLANASVEHLKAWIRGDDPDFGDDVIAAIHRNYGMSQYVLRKIGQGAPLEALAGIIAPPYKVVDDVTKSIINMDTKFLDYVPPYGKAINELFDLKDE